MSPTTERKRAATASGRLPRGREIGGWAVRRRESCPWGLLEGCRGPGSGGADAGVRPERWLGALGRGGRGRRRGGNRAIADPA